MARKNFQSLVEARSNHINHRMDNRVSAIKLKEAIVSVNGCKWAGCRFFVSHKLSFLCGPPTTNFPSKNLSGKVDLMISTCYLTKRNGKKSIEASEKDNKKLKFPVITNCASGPPSLRCWRLQVVILKIYNLTRDAKMRLKSSTRVETKKSLRIGAFLVEP